MFFLLGSCATVDARLPDISLDDLATEQEFQEQRAFSEMATLRDRLMRVSYPILSQNADICSKTRKDVGALTHTLKSYSKKLREGAAREISAKDYPTLMYVRPGSPANKAGLEVGDTILDENGHEVSLPSKGLINALESVGAMTYVRGGETQHVDINPDIICAYDMKLKMTPTINAYATGKSIIVTSGMINFVESDEELALIIGHELAHNELSHVRKIISNLVLSGFATRYTRPFESEADYVGMYYMVRAGYNIDGVENIWRRLGTLSPRGIAHAKTHPQYPNRYLRLSATRKEIEAKIGGGAPLTPNMKDGL